MGSCCLHVLFSLPSASNWSRAQAKLPVRQGFLSRFHPVGVREGLRPALLVPPAGPAARVLVRLSERGRTSSVRKQPWKLFPGRSASHGRGGRGLVGEPWTPDVRSDFLLGQSRAGPGPVR